uniref:Uncharacterized protein n=1 Tax=Anopheles melas TaxID=34690 RepID=A0A182TZ22_9DIPT
MKPNIESMLAILTAARLMKMLLLISSNGFDFERALRMSSAPRLLNTDLLASIWASTSGSQYRCSSSISSLRGPTRIHASSCSRVMPGEPASACTFTSQLHTSGNLPKPLRPFCEDVSIRSTRPWPVLPRPVPALYPICFIIRKDFSENCENGAAPPAAAVVPAAPCGPSMAAGAIDIPGRFCG